jgi:Flp pilus assembly protein TadB
MAVDEALEPRRGLTVVAVASAVALTVLVLARWRPRAARLIELAAAAPPAGVDTPRRLLRAHRVVLHRVLPVGLAAIVLGPFAAAAAVIGVSMWPRVCQTRDIRRAHRRARLAYPDFVDMLVLSIKSGCTPRQALEALLAVAPPAVRPGIAAALQRADGGQRFAEAVAALQEPPPVGLGPTAQPLVDSLALADRYGTPLPPILDRLAGEARAHRRRNAEAAARRLPIQLSFPLVGCTLPSFVLLTIVPLMAGTFSSLHGLTP